MPICSPAGSTRRTSLTRMRSLTLGSLIGVPPARTCRRSRRLVPIQKAARRECCLNGRPSAPQPVAGWEAGASACVNCERKSRRGRLLVQLWDLRANPVPSPNCFSSGAGGACPAGRLRKGSLGLGVRQCLFPTPREDSLAGVQRWIPPPSLAALGPPPPEREEEDRLLLLVGSSVYAIRQVVRWGGAWIRGRVRRLRWGGEPGSMVKPWPWITTWWWNQHTVDRFSASVRPPSDHGVV